MSLRNTSENYGSLAKWFHWTTAILVIGMLIYGSTITTFIPKGAFRSNLIMIHKSIGLLILVLLIVRWTWSWINPKPRLLSVKNRFLKIGTIWFHELLYVGIAIMLLSGVLMTAFRHLQLPFFGLFNISTTWFPENKAVSSFFRSTHGIMAWILVNMIALHIAAAIKHHFFNKDDTLKRML